MVSVVDGWSASWPSEPDEEVSLADVEGVVVCCENATKRSACLDPPPSVAICGCGADGKSLGVCARAIAAVSRNAQVNQQSVREIKLGRQKGIE
jgi:hypothetical protein